MFIPRIRNLELYGSDSCRANIVLLQKKYNTEFRIFDGVFFRNYRGEESRKGYAFPLLVAGTEAENYDYLKFALEYIIQQAKNAKEEPSLCLITQEQKKLIDDCLARNFPNYKVLWKTNKDDCDYIYLRENLALLPGSNYQKKRNHVSRFNRIYGNSWKYKAYPQNEISSDILKVAQTWYEEKISEGENKTLNLELQGIREALEKTQELQMQGGVLYVNESPIAMTLASPISDCVMDVIYEKAVSAYEKDGAYAVINQQFAKRCEGFLYLNREEDMGIEGIRKAKLSYKPSILLEKFYGKIVSI